MVRLLLCCFFFVSLSAEAASLVTLKKETSLTSDTIKLSDVFEGISPQKDLDIALAPKPGQSVTYDIRVLTRLAEAYHLDWQAQSYQDHALLKREAQFITLDMIKPLILAKLKEGREAPTKTTAYDLSFTNRSFSLALPTNLEFEYELAHFIYDKTSHNFRTKLKLKTSKGDELHPLSGRVTIKKYIPVLAHHVKAGTILSSHDLKWKWINERQLSTTTLSQEKELIGKELRQAKAEGRPFYARDVSSPRLVLRGALVTMKIETPLMAITAQGKALQDGVKGETVRVKNSKSNRVIEAVVTAEGTVQVKALTPAHLAAL